jgi:glycosyltransferase involved in cell wall biosynthesis
LQNIHNLFEGALVEKKHLLILTYEMDELSQVFSHQIGIVNELSKSFDKVTVLTGKIGSYSVSPNVRVYSSNWQRGKRISSTTKFLFVFFKLLLSSRFTVIFSHMTSAQGALISPITRVLRIKHLLWYTHTSDNFALRVCNLFTNGILTATAGSCPLGGSKVHVIGHSIDTRIFKRKSSPNFPISSFVHVGRFDPSKNIRFIIETLQSLTITKNNVSFTNIGLPSGEANGTYYQNIISEFDRDKNLTWIKFESSVPRQTLPSLLNNFDCFIHAFNGSLDKAVLEATFIRLPVVTINPEYKKIFGSWDKNNRSKKYTLLEEVNFLLDLTKEELSAELDRRYQIAQKDYELEGWANRVITVMDNLR